MIEVRETEHFANWFKALRDMQARARILARLRNVSLGTLGDVASVGEGVGEFRIHYGPGYRVYFMQISGTIIILLGGGDKSTQKDDIAAAKALKKKVKE
ncbi:type II toxin-antitoxin system RelE/ParE family toxin [Mesorhizobium sp.]|uniref:type II toxin-antitoxin system RelE/ParE family toxin n=1 Tax=Mesorhizobium sp. TaxID=1871066 RepID=UPI000FE705C6|nr:type II toxin-antitoxin system RelE/ParE family toxin [Mesorhizobium sp.]RWF03014.1 MAG: type II toxin-antitoxin system RelE/ParE family toxin [Mesorhizobium sp.]